MTYPLHVELCYPAEELSPNARKHPMAVARVKKAAKKEAFWATRFVAGINRQQPQAPVAIKLIFHPKPKGPTMDKDNAIACCKAHLDGIAQALDVNDRDFEAPTVEFADRCQYGKLIVVVG